jgi:hypothetical protein
VHARVCMCVTACVQRWCCRVSVVAANAFFLWLLFSIPNSSLGSVDGALVGGTLGLLAFVVLLSLGAFFWLQGSDPGYLTKGASAPAPAP